MFLLLRKSKKFWENVRKWSKICFFSLNKFFIFHFLRLFLDRNQVYKVLGCLPCPFFRFFALLCRKIHFLLSNLAIFAKPKEILTKSTVCGRKCRTFYQKFFDFLTSRNAFWAKVPMRKVVQNDSFYRFPNKFSTGYLPFRHGLVYGDRCTENWLKNASKTVATY